jgi:hypothetical protein
MDIRGDHDNSVPRDSRANGRTENNNRDIKFGAASPLTRAGMPLTYWPLALQCYCFGHNAAVVDGNSPYRERFGGNFGYDKLYPFGPEVVFIPSEVTGGDTLQFGPTGKCGIFFRYGINSSCVWSGAYLVARVNGFADMNYHTGERESDNNVITVQMVRDVKRPDNVKDGNFRFPLKQHNGKAFTTPEGWVDCWWGQEMAQEPTSGKPSVANTNTTAQDDLLRIHTAHLDVGDGAMPSLDNVAETSSSNSSGDHPHWQ